jgi:hypothetical protein
VHGRIELNLDACARFDEHRVIEDVDHFGAEDPNPTSRWSSMSASQSSAIRKYLPFAGERHSY